MPDAAVCDCGHPRKSHRHGGGNAHGSYTWLSSCQKADCDCQGWDPDGDGDD